MTRPRNPLNVAAVALAMATAGIGRTSAESPSPTPKSESRRALDEFVAREQPLFGWEIIGRDKTPGLTRIDLKLTSQQWRDTVWRHHVRVFRPDSVEDPQCAVVFVNGGSNGREPGLELDTACISLASLAEMPVIVLSQVPNQPLMGDRYEDALIAASWLRYLETEDETWPLLFPMVNSAVKAMDCAQAVLDDEFGDSVDRFVITGASKRGWTSWLTAAADSRIAGTAPMVIDTLNFRPQMRDQKEIWGGFSEQINDYTRAGLVVLGDEQPAEKKLRLMMDPYTYRRRLELPKLIINGTNDRYWRVDAIRNYWSGLPGPKNVLNIPNAGHSLEGGQLQVVATLAAFARKCAVGETLPQIEWDYETRPETRELEFRVLCERPATDISFWVAFSPTRDFRNSEWQRREADRETGTESTIVIDVPKDQNVAIFGDVRIGPFLRDHHLSTGVVQPAFP